MINNQYQLQKEQVQRKIQKLQATLEYYEKLDSLQDPNLDLNDKRK